jgi:hypothetical protein
MKGSEGVLWTDSIIRLSRSGAACRAGQFSADDRGYQPIASIREIMEAETDPSADVLWDAVFITIEPAGEVDHQPRTEEEWKAVRRSALTLIESTNLLVMEGRRIVAPNFQVPPGEPDPHVLQQRLDSNRTAFNGFAQALRALGLESLAAIDARDADKLFRLGGDIDEACEACHLVFWYPADLVKN